MSIIPSYNVQVFSLESFKVEIQIDEQGNSWFKANDVCESLGYDGNPRDAVSKHVELEDVAKRDGLANDGKTREMNYINESGLYSLIMGSKLPSAKKFKNWVTSVVLPSIRKTGEYKVNNKRNFDTLTSGEVFKDFHLVAEILGLRKEQAAYHANQATKKITGIDTLSLMDYRVTVDSVTKSLSDWIKECNIKVSAKKANLLLCEAGYLLGGPGNWSLSDEGNKIGRLVAQEDNYSGKVRVNIEWEKDVVRVLELLNDR